MNGAERIIHYGGDRVAAAANRIGNPARDWSIQEIAKLAGTTSRTLRHYDDLGLLPPTRIGTNGYRYYDSGSLVTLQRILLLRDLGLGLTTIGEILTNEADAAPALERHIEWLRLERNRLDRQIAAVENTVTALKAGDDIMAEDMFDGFDNSQYKDEVEERWGKDAYAASNNWWNSKSSTEKREFEREAAQLISDWVDAASRDIDATGDEAQALAKRQVEWFAVIPGIPESDEGRPSKHYVSCIGDMYVGDPRFAKNYETETGGTAGAEFVRDALKHYAEHSM